MDYKTLVIKIKSSLRMNFSSHHDFGFCQREKRAVKSAHHYFQCLFLEPKFWLMFMESFYTIWSSKRLLGEIIHQHWMRYHHYMDDTQLYISIHGELTFHLYLIFFLKMVTTWLLASFSISIWGLNFLLNLDIFWTTVLVSLWHLCLYRCCCNAASCIF